MSGDSKHEILPTAETAGVAGVDGEGDSPSQKIKSTKHVAAQVLKTVVGSAKGAAVSIKEDTHSLAQEIQVECFQLFDVYEVIDFVKGNWYKMVYIPYFPAFHQPGWLLRYVVGPHTSELATSMIADFGAGVTVAMTLVPQALSYAVLANLPAVNGLYTATLPSATYTFFGSSMQLAVGPVALVSLLQAQLINKYGITPGSPEAVDFAGECAIAIGFILTAMSLLNLGNLIRFISHPVMSAFTTAAACIIGQNQLKSAFGFVVSPPQTGQDGYEWNYQVLQWYIDNWNLNDATTKFHHVRSFLATRICLGLYFSMMVFVVLKLWIKPTPARKKTWVFYLWSSFVNLLPLVAIIIGGHLAWQIKHDDHYNAPETEYHHDFYAQKLSIVSIVTPGLDFLRIPSMKWPFGALLADVFPTALVLFMESWSVAQRIATQNNQLHLLNASQELWAMGCANFLSGICSAYPVAGSFSRSSLNQSAGAKTPLSKATTLIVVILTLRYLTRAFQYIPNAALAAVIWVAIFNLVSISDFWHAWKHSKKDFFIMIVTWVVVYVADTGTGLAAGLAVSVLVFLWDNAFNAENGPQIINTDEEHERGNVIHIRFRADINFLTAGRFSDTVTNYTLLQEDRTRQREGLETVNDQVFYRVSDFLDAKLRPQLSIGVAHLPKAIIVDLVSVYVIDMTAMHTIEDMANTCRDKKIAFTIINASDSVAKQLAKFGYHNDSLTNRIKPELAQRYNAEAGDILPLKVSNVADAAKESVDDQEEGEGGGLMMVPVAKDAEERV